MQNIRNNLTDKQFYPTKTPQNAQLEIDTTHKKDSNVERLETDNVIVNLEQEGAKDDEAGTTIIQDLSQDPTLVLHNSFTFLHD
jgi:hypothetical protein